MTDTRSSILHPTASRSSTRVAACKRLASALPKLFRRIFASPHLRAAAVIGAGFLAAPSAQAYVGDWTSSTHLGEIRDMRSAYGYLWMATGGGIRRMAPDNSEKVYRNTEGLRDVGIQALTVTPEGDLWASSELGFLYHLRPDLKGWEIEGTAYKSSAWAMNLRALTYRAGYLVLGSKKGLTFFSTRRRLAEANITKMGKVNDLSVNSVLFVGDTLFAGTSKGIFRAVLHMDKLLSDPEINIFNPAIWSLVPGTESLLAFDPTKDTLPGAALLAKSVLARRALLKRGRAVADSVPAVDTVPKVDTVSKNDTVPVDPTLGRGDDVLPLGSDAKLAHGVLYYGPHGIESKYIGGSIPESNCRVSKFGKITLDGKSFINLYHMECVAKFNGRWFAGNWQFLHELFPSDTIAYRPLLNGEDLPQSQFTALRSTNFGMYAWAAPSVYHLVNRQWEEVASFVVTNNALESKQRGLHTLEVTDPDHIYSGTWTEGYLAQVNGRQTKYTDANSCLQSAVESGPGAIVVESQATFQNRGMWLGSFKETKPYRLSFFDFATQSIECFETGNVDLYPRNLQIVGDVLVVVTERGVDAYRIRTTSGRVSIGSENLLSGLAKPANPPMASHMDNLGNLWVTSEGSTLMYIPNIQFGSGADQSLHTLDGFTGSSCMNAQSDPLGHVWIGCTEGGLFEVIPGRDTLSHTFRHYGLTEGLVSEIIYHVEVDQHTGAVWVATDKGLSMYQSSSRPVLENLNGVKVYPNPFLPKHNAVIFDNLAEGSEVDVLTQAGSVVWHRSLQAGDGGQIRWEGRNRADERVKEGVYFWRVRSGGDVRNGKLIVAR